MSPITDDLVSVILPVHNGAKFVEFALESALRQTHRNLEVVAIDDGSTDDTLKILEKYAARDPRVRVFSQANGGVARARNRAIAEARGEFIAPLDADDLWEPSKIASQLQRLIESGEETGFVYSWWIWIDRNGVVLDRSPRWKIEGEAFERLTQINFSGNASVPLFRKRCIQEAGGYNEELAASDAGGCEDWELVLRIAEHYKIAVVPDVLIGYRRLPSSMSTSCDRMWRSHQAVMRTIRARRPDLDSRLFRRSDQQFEFYLAGVSFWSGNPFATLRWALRSGWRHLILVLPYASGIFANRDRGTKGGQTMLPGVPLDMNGVPEPLLPYDKF
jgi:glycosyltransferase involved in cell wall biosynthesis